MVKSREVNLRMVIIGLRIDHRRDERRHAAAVGQAQVHDRRVGIEFLAETIGDHFKAGQQCAVLKTDAG